MELDPIETFGHCAPADFARAYRTHAAEQATLLRETRRTVAQLHDRADQRRPRSGALELDYPVEELAAESRPAEPARQSKSAKQSETNQDQPQITKPNRSNRRNPRKTLEIPAPAAPETIPGPPADQLMREAEIFLDDYRKQGIPTPAR